MTNIIFHIFPVVAFSKETVNIEIWTLFVLKRDFLGEIGIAEPGIRQGQTILQGIGCDGHHKTASSKKIFVADQERSFRESVMRSGVGRTEAMCAIKGLAQ